MLSRHVSDAAARESNNRGIRNQCLAAECHRTSKVHCNVLVSGWWSQPSFVFFLRDSCLGECTETNYGHDCHVDE
ncbi:hypothetical protein NC651_013477 [Populus alba x Populus x berolinensis]|nr:hypothetical protein NC651_013477 [Populus alba x Populus x berolinensis]